MESNIKTFEDACKALGKDTALPDFSLFPDSCRKQLAAHYQLMIIAEALNEGWKPDWENHNQYKYWPWFYMQAGVGFSYGGYAYGYTATSVGSRLCFKSWELAKYAGKQFQSSYQDLLNY